MHRNPAQRSEERTQEWHRVPACYLPTVSTGHFSERAELRFEEDEKLSLVQHELLESQVLEPLAQDTDDTRRWLDWELAVVPSGFF
jgi:hypothetical protein